MKRKTKKENNLRFTSTVLRDAVARRGCRRGHWDVVEDDPRRAARSTPVGSYRGFSSGSALMGASASIRPRHACCSPASPALGGKPNPSRPRPGHRPCPSRRVTAAQLARRERSQIRLRQKHLASKIWPGVRVASRLLAWYTRARARQAEPWLGRRERRCAGLDEYVERAASLGTSGRAEGPSRPYPALIVHLSIHRLCLSWWHAASPAVALRLRADAESA